MGERRRGECHVWWASPADAREGLLNSFNEQERDRVRRYRFDVDRHRFMVGCALTRGVLAGQLGVFPDQVPLTRVCAECAGPHGRPVVADSGWYVSVSHSGQRVGVAVTDLGPVGLDVEEATESMVDVASDMLSPVEQKLATPVDRVERIMWLGRYWVRKEAVLKAAGTGLMVAMGSLEVSSPDIEPRVVSSSVLSLGEMAMADLSDAGQHLSAVAVCTDADIRVIEHDGAPILATLSG